MDGMFKQVAKVAPGTPLRDAIDRIIRARTGAMIVIGGEPDIDEDCQGGFRLDVPVHPSLVYELAKMDGAILLDSTMSRIRMANVEMVPHLAASTTETGIRHRTADRVAKTRNALVVAISERRGTVSLYFQGERFVLHDLSYILTKAQGAVNSLSRYDRLFRGASRRLAEAELYAGVMLEDVVEVLRRGLVAHEIRQELEGYIVELGKDGHLIDLQMEEFPDILREWHWIWHDYQAEDGAPINLRDNASQLTDDDWYQALGYSKRSGERLLIPRGYRVLHQVPRLPDGIIQQLIKRYQDVRALASASIADLDEVEGVGPQRASLIYRALHPQDNN
ncbi:DNA integrity scanning diadenylate cyclase DisA [Sulfobacillus harzensis]|uniref:DNA integrity scanning protein DisA n=1 Tax=Sulfobacillus harzensis TaxID=2729629 RepID=A0A7Y0Q3G3_9FIRM|nr:DNA integrity scanning diadenylate cyclase DisA [Sulfobacillus harzensis]NMP22159.1 DNA integrity scanning protein DisA [Sulfobacillus harzensis]